MATWGCQLCGWDPLAAVLKSALKASPRRSVVFTLHAAARAAILIELPRDVACLEFWHAGQAMIWNRVTWNPSIVGRRLMNAALQNERGR